MQLLTELNRNGKTIIMVTHENDIAAWARRVVRMRDGLIESDVRNDAGPRQLAHAAAHDLPEVTLPAPHGIWSPEAPRGTGGENS
jgi:putative ABC transport system ATP-binding protein